MSGQGKDFFTDGLFQGLPLPVQRVDWKFIEKRGEYEDKYEASMLGVALGVFALTWDPTTGKAIGIRQL